MRDTVVRHPSVAAFTLGWAALFAGASPALAARRVWPYLVVVGTVAVLVARVDRRVHLPGPVLAAISVLGLAHCAGGLLPSPDPSVPVLYETWLLPGVLKVDQAVHAYGTGVACVGAWYAAPGTLRPSRRGVRAILVATAIGLGNELIEFVLDLRLPTHVGGYDNAAWDLVFNSAGALLVSLVLVGSAPDAGTPRDVSRGRRGPVVEGAHHHRTAVGTSSSTGAGGHQ